MIGKTSFKFGPGAFRLFLASTVVVHHTFPLRLGGWAVYVFFILSGYWICFMWQGKYQRTLFPWLTFCVSRWWRLAPVFMTCTALGVVSAKLLQPPMPAASGSSHDLVWWVRQFLIAGSASAGRVLPPSWSLDVEMQFYLLAPIIVALLLLLSSKGRLLAAFGGFLYLAFHTVSGTPAETPRLDLYLGCFLIGIWLQQSQWRPPARIAWASLAAFFALTLGFLLLPATRNGIWVRGEDAMLSSISAIPGWPHLWWAVGALLAVPFVAHNVSLPSPPRDRWMGNLAYPLYLFHWITRDWYYKYVDWSQPMGRNLLLLGLSWLAAFFGAALMLTFVDQPIDKRRANWVEKRKLPVETVSTSIARSVSPL